MPFHDFWSISSLVVSLLHQTTCRRLLQSQQSAVEESRAPGGELWIRIQTTDGYTATATPGRWRSRSWGWGGGEQVNRQVPALPQSDNHRAMVFRVRTQDKKTLWCPQNWGQCHVTADSLETTDTGIDKHLQSKCCGSGFYQKAKKWNWQRSCQATTPTLSILEHSTLEKLLLKMDSKQTASYQSLWIYSFIFVTISQNPSESWVTSISHIRFWQLGLCVVQRGVKSWRVQKPDQIVR